MKQNPSSNLPVCSNNWFHYRPCDSMDRMDKLRKLYPDAMQRAYYTVKLLSEPEGRLEYLKDPDDEFVKNALELMFGECRALK